MIHHQMAVDTQLTLLIHTFQEIEAIDSTIMPFPYAQFIKVLILFYILCLPYGLAAAMQWYTPVAVFFAAMVFTTIDRVAVVMEAPFGHHPASLDLEKRFR